MILDVVYNHTARRQPAGPDAVDARRRQRLVLPAVARRSRATTWISPAAATRLNMVHPRVLQLIMDSLRYWVLEMHVDGFRFDLASTLARELYRRQQAGGVLRHHPSGSRPLAGQADRRAVGRRRGRLSGRQLPRALDRVERQVSRLGPPLLEGRRRHRLRIRHAPQRHQRSLRAERPPALRQHQLRHLPRRLHAARSGQLQRQAQRSQRRRQQGRRQRQQ